MMEKAVSSCFQQVFQMSSPQYRDTSGSSAFRSSAWSTLHSHYVPPNSPHARAGVSLRCFTTPLAYELFVEIAGFTVSYGLGKTFFFFTFASARPFMRRFRKVELFFLQRAIFSFVFSANTADVHRPATAMKGNTLLFYFYFFFSHAARSFWGPGRGHERQK